jgi:anti-sigma regulatory factor (Ser/Thr protein kinase)
MATRLATPLRGPVTLRVPFDPAGVAEVRHALEAWLRHHEVTDAVLDDARLICSELVANAVRHATPLRHGTVLVRWRITDGLFNLSVCDGGGSSAPTLTTADEDALGGRGLAIVEALASSWWVERTARTRAVHVRMGIGLLEPAVR